MTALIHKKMAAIINEIGPISKDRTNSMQNFKFRGIDDIYNALNPIFSKNGVYNTINVLEHSVTERQNHKGTTLFYVYVKVEYAFYAEDGSSIKCTAMGEAMDSGDKATNKAMAAAHKYCLLQTFCVPTEGDNDPDAYSHEVAPKRPPVSHPIAQPPFPEAKPIPKHPMPTIQESNKDKVLMYHDNLKCKESLERFLATKGKDKNDYEFKNKLHAAMIGKPWTELETIFRQEQLK